MLGREELRCPRNGGVLSAQCWALEVHTKAPTCLFQALHVSLGMASLTGSRLELCGGAGNSCSVHSCLFPSPGPYFSLLCWPCSFTKHSLSYTQWHSLLEYSPFPPETREKQVQNKVPKHWGYISDQWRPQWGYRGRSPERRQPRARDKSWVLKDA